MKSRLTGKPDSRCADGRYLGHELGIEPQVRRQLRFLPELLRLLFNRLPIGGLRRCVQVAIDPLEAAVDGVWRTAVSICATAARPASQAAWACDRPTR